MPLLATAVSADHAPVLITLPHCGLLPLLQLSVLLLNFLLSRAPHTSTALLFSCSGATENNCRLQQQTIPARAVARSTRMLLCVRCVGLSIFHETTVLKSVPNDWIQCLSQRICVVKSTIHLWLRTQKGLKTNTDKKSILMNVPARCRRQNNLYRESSDTTCRHEKQISRNQTSEGQLHKTSRHQIPGLHVQLLTTAIHICDISLVGFKVCNHTLIV